MVKELVKKSCIRIVYRINAKIKSFPGMANIYRLKKFERDSSKTVTCRVLTDIQTNRQTNKWKRSQSETYENQKMKEMSKKFLKSKKTPKNSKTVKIGPKWKISRSLVSFKVIQRK